MFVGRLQVATQLMGIILCSKLDLRKLIIILSGVLNIADRPKMYACTERIMIVRRGHKPHGL